MTNTTYTKYSGSEAAEPITEFEVSKEGKLSVEGFIEAEIRADFFEDATDGWEGSPSDLVYAMDSCRPLALGVYAIYSGYRDELQSEIDKAENGSNPDRNKINALKEQLASMPDEPEGGAEEWLQQLDNEFFEANIVEQIRNWFSEPLDWVGEGDYIPESSTGQGAAMVYFRDNMALDSLELLGVEVIEGECPGSSYYAAELRNDIDEANAAAETAGLPVRFIKSKE